MIEKLKKIKRYINNKIFYGYRITQVFFQPKLNYKKWEGELFVYHGSLIEGDVQYEDGRFVGFSVCNPIHSKDVKLSSAEKFPLPDNSVDAFQTEDVMEHIPYEKIIVLFNEIYRILKPGGLNIYTVRNEHDGDYKRGIHRGEDMYENEGFIVHFFNKPKIKQLTDGFKNIKIESFEEGKFPRKLYFVVNKKI